MESNALELPMIPGNQQAGPRENVSTELEQLDSAKTLCSKLGKISLATVYRMAKAGDIPSYGVGRRGVRFMVEEVRQALRR